MGNHFLTLQGGHDHAEEVKIALGLRVLYLFGVFLISLSIISMAIFSCGENGDSNTPRRRRDRGDDGGDRDSGGGCGRD
ncbi:uncharacterized protein DS421_8g241770 [Arachis hypogaea]|nr:uncharacterized protein DS421_8g241770 [Arachis hypogaea]